MASGAAGMGNRNSQIIEIHNLRAMNGAKFSDSLFHSRRQEFSDTARGPARGANRPFALLLPLSGFRQAPVGGRGRNAMAAGSA
jgi:hypothetical protein